MAKILLVEDDNNLREIYEARLQAEGYTIVSARDGEEALVVAKAERPDLVISDVMMPKISGFEMLDILRNTEGLQHVKVIMLTALGQSEDQQRADKLGADRYLVKSQVTLEDIVNVSQQLLQDAGALDSATAAPATSPAASAVPDAPAASAPEPTAPAPVPEPATPAEPAPAPPVIPLATAPQDELAPTGDVQMPPTPASTAPVTPADNVAPAASAPKPTAEPAAEPAAASTTATDQPQTTAEESAAVKEQINTFVASQSGEAPQQVEPSAEPAAVEPETTQPETGPAPDEVVAQAAQSLSGEPAVAPKSDAPSEPASEAETTTHKKVIKPLTDEQPTKKSLDQLLAEEAAKQGGPAAAQTGANPKPLANPNDFDPNSIAL